MNKDSGDINPYLDWIDYVHKQLGKCKRNISIANSNGDYFTEVVKISAMKIESLDCIFHNLSIFIKNAEEPSKKMIDEVQHVLELPKEDVPLIEKYVFDHYMDELYPLFRKSFVEQQKSDPELDDKQIDAILPMINSEKQVWQLFGEPEAISCNDEDLSLSFACTFDDAHHWNIVYSDGKFEHVYLG